MLAIKDRAFDPDDPVNGGCLIWMTDGTGTGDAGDVFLTITSGGATKTATLADFSAL